MKTWLAILLCATMPFAASVRYLFSFGALPENFRQLKDPVAVTGGADGSLLVVDAGFNRVVKYTPQGKFVAEAGGAGSGDGMFDCPAGITRRKGFGLFICDSRNSRLVQIDDRLNFISSLSLDNKTGDGVFAPAAVTADNSGMLYAVDYENGTILSIDRDSRVQKLLNVYADLRGKTVRPRSVAVLKNSLYLDDEQTRRIYRFDTFGNFLGSFGDSLAVPPCGLSPVGDSLLAVADTRSKGVILLAENGERKSSFSAYTARGSFLPGAIHYAGGRFYIINSENHSVSVFGNE